jgi:hypothetical protein
MALGLFSYIAYASTLSRSGFLILLIGTASTFMLLPKGERFRKFVRGIIFMPILAFACWGALNLGDSIIGRGFAGKVNKHFMTLIPDSDRSGSDEKAWDSRLGGIAAEIALWARSPLTGQGFGAGETEYLAGHASGGTAFKHNGWTSSLAETGLFGFAGLALLVATLLRLGYKAVHDRIDPGCVLMGAVAFLSGVTFLLRCSTTYAVTSRSALAYGLICGMIIRAREIQETCRALAFQQQQQQQQQYDPYVDERTGLVVPDYGYSDYGYGYGDYAPGFGYN